MSATQHQHHHCHGCESDALMALKQKAKYALWIALVVNASMFVIEMGSSFHAKSVSLIADAVDFFGDAASYAITLFVMDRSQNAKNRAAWIKALAMMAMGIWALGAALYRIWYGVLPESSVMGAVGVLAFAANLGVALVLYQHRNLDINMKSVWLCSRNDALGNLAVVGAAAGVWVSVTRWPDLIVALIISGLNLSGGIQVLRELLSKKSN